MILFVKQLLSISLCILSVLYTNKALSHEMQSKYSDSLTTKSSEYLIHRIQNSNADVSKIYETALYASTDDELILAQYQYAIASSFYNLEKYERSIYYLNKGIKLAETNQIDSLICKYAIKSGNAYLKDWKNQKSLDAYYYALKIAQTKGSIDHQIVAKSGISIILLRTGQLDKALEICKNALTLIENSDSSYKNSKNHVRFFTIISEIYLDQKKYDSVIHHADIGIRMAQQLDYPIGAIDLYTKKGIIYFEKNKLDKALYNLYKAEDILVEKNIKQKKSIFNLNYFIASCFYKEKKYDKAISQLEKVIPILTEKDSRNMRVLDIYRLLANCYTAMDKKEESILWWQKLIKLQDQFQDDKNKTVIKLHTKATEELANQIKALENQKKKEKQHKEYIFITLLLVCMVLVILIFKYLRKQKNNKKRFEELIKKIDSLETKENSSTKSFIITDEKVNDVLSGLRKLEEQEYFLNKDCDLRSMAKKVKTNTTYLSKIIKKHKANSFNDYINNLRIEYVLKRLKNDKKFRSFSIKSIALEIGYKTDNSFTKHFKSKTGLNPSYYIKKINTDVESTKNH